MLQKFKNFVFLISKYSGLFSLSRRLMRNKVRVLCYHGFSARDEQLLYKPGLYIEPAAFEKRLNYLKRKGYRVLGLDEAYQSISQQQKMHDRVVITIDDGFVNLLTEAASILGKYDYPSTLYLTSYYFDNDCPVFTLALGYMFWKSRQTRVDLSSLHIPSLSQGEYELTHESRVEISEQVIAFGESLKGNESRIALLKQVGQILDVGYEQLNKDRLFNLLSKKELEEVRKYRVDIEMHTHRHTLPENQAVALKEIRDNRAVIEPLISKTMRHFCYPSGVWSTRHWQPLQQAQILTATTCETGLVDEKTPVLAWPRIVDSSRVSQLEFEAEISGFNELIRSLRSHFRLSNRESVSNASNIEAPETTAR